MPIAWRLPAKTGENPFPEGRFSALRKEVFKRLAQQSPPSVKGGGERRETVRPRLTGLLQLDLGASCFQLSLELVGVGLGNAFLDRLRSRFDQVLGFLEAKAGDGADFLDDVDLLGAGIGENNVEFRLLFSRSSGSGSTTATGGNSHRSGGRNAPLLFQELRQLGRLEDGQLRKVVYDLREISHFDIPLVGSNVCC
ncbi:hypothetical protein MPLSOD_470010 [Mesorhizobium sp. SOD10]|nr:hypothetical protein MPLSOD_470010 [Mesorhizobium sp. SOD10]